MDFGLILGAMTEEPTFVVWLGWKVLAWLGVAAGLTFVIFVHELGHFLVAKACGVKCEKFYVGFDFFEFRFPFTNWKIPRSLFKFQWGETEYGLGSLPLGGYVKMLGQDDDPRNAEKEAARIRAAAPGADEARVEAIASGKAAEGFVSGQSVEALTNEALAHAPHPGEKAADEPPVPAQTTEGKTILLDPRSYPAKAVPARMAIISAGVIMNLIFAVILASIAYRLGVEETPAIVGSTSPGGAAWQAGIEPGSRIIQIGTDGEPYDYLRFSDIRTTAVLNSEHEVGMLLRGPNGKDAWYQVEAKKIPGVKMPQYGIGGPHNPEIEQFPDRVDHFNPKSSIPLRDHDKVIEAAGQKVTNGADLTAIFAQQPLGALSVKVERRERTQAGKLVENSTKTPEILDVVLEPKPIRELGLVMKAGPIMAVRTDSPAQRAGLLIDDQIVEVNGQPIGDPLSLSQRLTPRTSQDEPVSFTIERRDKQGKVTRRTVSVERELPLQSPMYLLSNATSIEPIGVAFELTLEVAEVATGSPAAEVGIAVGDVLTEIELLDDPQRIEELNKAKHIFIPKKVELADKKGSWPVAMHLFQRIYPDTKVKATWNRRGEKMSAVMTPRDSESFWDDTRGVILYDDTQLRVANNWRLAAELGFREASEQVTQVLTILNRLFTFRLSFTNLSGPAGIIAVAGAFASEGLPTLLLFLTMLSANLAVLNFMPIPALDGGHMLFLSAEAVRGKPVDENLQAKLTIVGVVCLLSLMVFATAMDIHRFTEMIQRLFG